MKTLAQLPGKKLTVATVGGINFHTGKMYFLVADGVHSLGGDFRCVARAPGELCELLEIEAGFPLELTYGPNKVLYRIKVTGVRAVWAGKPGDQRSKSGGRGTRRASAATQPRSSSAPIAAHASMAVRASLAPKASVSEALALDSL